MVEQEALLYFVLLPRLICIIALILSPSPPQHRRSISDYLKFFLSEFNKAALNLPCNRAVKEDSPIELEEAPKIEAPVAGASFPLEIPLLEPLEMAEYVPCYSCTCSILY
jgi:hypothetical protein